MYFSKHAPSKAVILLMAVWVLMTAVSGAEPEDAVLHYSFSEPHPHRVNNLAADRYHALVDSTNGYQPDFVPGGLRLRGAKQCLSAFRVDAMNTGDSGFMIELVFELEPDIPANAVEDHVGALISANYKKQSDAWKIYISRDGYLFFMVRNPTGEFNASRSDKPLAIGEPVHILAVLTEDDRWDTMRRELYINGDRQQHVARGASVALHDNIRITIGAQEPSRNHVQGILRDVRLYARPLSSEEDPALLRGRRMANSDD